MPLLEKIQATLMNTIPSNSYNCPFVRIAFIYGDKHQTLLFKDGKNAIWIRYRPFEHP